MHKVMIWTFGDIVHTFVLFWYTKYINLYTEAQITELYQITPLSTLHEQDSISI